MLYNILIDRIDYLFIDQWEHNRTIFRRGGIKHQKIIEPDGLEQLFLLFGSMVQPHVGGDSPTLQCSSCSSVSLDNCGSEDPVANGNGSNDADTNKQIHDVAGIFRKKTKWISGMLHFQFLSFCFF